MEGLCFKRLEESYRGGVRSWRKYKVRVTNEAVIGALTGSFAAPRTPQIRPRGLPAVSVCMAPAMEK